MSALPVRIGAMVGMHHLGRLLLAMAAAGSLAGCASATLPSLAGAPGAPAPLGDVARPAPPANAFETTFMVPGTPTAIYTLVARGALSCWVGASGPLHQTHVFAAAAAPPSAGGAAEIVLHERDQSFRDQRGPRAMRIAFEGSQGGVRMAINNLRMPVALAEAMSRDAARWANGGDGCEAQTVREPATVTGWNRPLPNLRRGGPDG
ncbi:MAG TPA: hypothetical protein VKF35_14675 [Hyphomicrobiaceae bacterium]|nr:hypothetical protein [Hyphomicrobiaceae bacterium]